MKNFFFLFLLFGLFASSFVSAEDRTSDPKDINAPIVGIADTDDNWQVDLASQDSLTNEDFNIAIKIQPSDQDDDDFDDYHGSDGDDNDDIPIAGASFGGAQREGLAKTADGDFDLDLIRKEILRKARDDQDFDYTNDDDDITDTDLTPQPERVDDDLRPDNGKISTQVVSTDDDNNVNDDEIEDSDDGDDADIIDDNTDSDDDDIDDDYQQDNDSAMADDDYVNDPDVANDDLADEVDYDNDDDSDDGDDATDNFIAQDYVKNTPFDSVNLQRIKLNMTTIDISPQDSDDTDDDLDDVYYNTDDDDDSDSDYDIYDSKYQEEPERGGLGSDDSNDSSYDYDLLIDIDDSALASYLTNDNDSNQ